MSLAGGNTLAGVNDSEKAGEDGPLRPSLSARGLRGRQRHVVLSPGGAMTLSGAC